MQRKRVKEAIIAAEYYVGAQKSASALIFIVDESGDVASYFMKPFSTGGSVRKSIIDKASRSGLFGERKEDEVCVRYWESLVERKHWLELCPETLQDVALVD